MKITRFVSTIALSIMFGMATPANGRQDHPGQQEDKPKPQEHGKPQEHQQTKPQERQQPEKPQQQDRQAPQPQAKGQQEQQQKQQHAQQAQSDKQQQQHEQQQVRSQQNQQDHGGQQSNAQQQRSDQQHYVQPVRMQTQQEQHRQEGEQQSAWQEHRAHNWQSEHRDWQQRGGYNGYRIPEDRYNGYFGSGHSFRIYSYPVMMVGGYPRFQYGGFWFSLVDPWPEYWSNNWYDNDDVYILYSDDGYYLYNRRDPRDRIAVSVYAD